MCGSKTTKVENKTDIPPETPEQQQLTAQYNAILDAQMSQNYDKIQTSTYVYDQQAQIDQIDQRIAALKSEGSGGTLYAGKFGSGGYNDPSLSGQIAQLENKKTQLMEQGGSNKINVQYVEKPDVKAARLRDQAATEKINGEFMDAASKLIRGDWSVSPTQKQQINDIIGDNFSKVMNTLTANLSTNEEDVKAAIQAQLKQGEGTIAENLRQRKMALEGEAESLGRSYTDTDFQRATGTQAIDANERLQDAAMSDTATQIAQLRQMYAQQIAGVQSQEGQTRLQLTMAAAQPLTAFGAGSQFQALQSQMQSQQLQNNMVPASMMGNEINQLNQLRLGGATRTSSTTQPFGVLDVLGGLAGLAGAVMPGIGALRGLGSLGGANAVAGGAGSAAGTTGLASGF